MKSNKQHVNVFSFRFHSSVYDRLESFWLAPSSEVKCSHNTRTCRHRTSSTRAYASYKMANNGFSTTYLIIVTNWLMVSSWGTRNFVLSSNGRSFSLWYLSTITCNKSTLTKWNRQSCLNNWNLIDNSEL